MRDDSFRKYLFISLAGAIGIILCIVFFFALFRFQQVMEGIRTLENILMPFIYGAVIAYLLTPVCNFVEIRLNILLKERFNVKEQKAGRFSAAMGIGLSLLFGFFIVYLLLAMVLPQVFVSVRGIVEVLPGNVVKWSDWIQQKLADDEVLANYAEQFINTAYQNMQVWLNTKLLPNMQVIVSGVSAGLISALVAVKNIVIGIFAAAYMMGNRKKFAAQGKKLIYSFVKVPVANGILDEINYINRVFGGFIDGKLLDSLIIGILCFVIMNLLNMPYTMLISVIIGVTNIIPFFGPFIGAIPCGLLIFLVNPLQAVYFAIFILVLQQFDGNILGPKILGDSTGLASFWVLFSILLFGGLFGFAGMVLGVPVFAMFYSIVSRLVSYGLRARGLPGKTEEYLGRTGPMSR